MKLPFTSTLISLNPGQSHQHATIVEVKQCRLEAHCFLDNERVP